MTERLISSTGHLDSDEESSDEESSSPPAISRKGKFDDEEDSDVG